MIDQLVPAPPPPASAPDTEPAAAMRIRFISDAPAADARVIRRFADPLYCAAVLETITVSAALAGVDGDQFDIILTPLSDATPSKMLDWIKSAKAADVPVPVSVPLGKARVIWRPGRMLIQGRTALPERALAAIAEFAFWEWHLRKLESAVTPHEAIAATDAKLAFEIYASDAAARAHFGKTMQALADLRLTFARLEPHLSIPSRSLTPPARRLISRLSRESLTEDRLEAVSDRLEACEDLYEGAIDRMSDHRWYRRGNLLEIAIVVLLLIEVVQLTIQMLMHLRN